MDRIQQLLQGMDRELIITASEAYFIAKYYSYKVPLYYVYKDMRLDGRDMSKYIFAITRGWMESNRFNILDIRSVIAKITEDYMPFINKIDMNALSFVLEAAVGDEVLLAVLYELEANMFFGTKLPGKNLWDSRKQCLIDSNHFDIDYTL